MPPAAVKAYRDLVCYEWAKAIARSAGFEGNFRFIMDKMKKLRAGELHMSEIIREDLLMAVQGWRKCVYCGASGSLSKDHLIPTSKGGKDIIENIVPSCRGCNSSKGGRDVLEWYHSRKIPIFPGLSGAST